AILNNGGFCLPLGNDRLINASCDRLDLRRGATATCSDRLTADNTPNNTNGNVYQFWFYDPNGSLSLIYPSANGATSNQVSMNQLPTLVEGRLYNVRVRTKLNTNTWRQWGPACRMKIDNAAGQCPSTQLQDEVGTHLSCGQSKPLGNGSASLVYAVPKTRFTASCGTQNANKYQFRFRIPAEGVVIVKSGVSSNPWTHLNMANVVGTPMPSGAVFQACQTYEVEVRASFDGGATWCTGGDPYTDLVPWGKVCSLSISGCASSLHALFDATTRTPELQLFPNPNSGDRFSIALSGIDEAVHTVSVDIYDTYGKRVSARTFAATDGFVNAVLELTG
ncbi:MAG TPA: hypothetical protein PK760_16665, partial [Flavobacteriales bacterium]|nr:hypothetical protein [Flavobacteriales bacterium]